MDLAIAHDYDIRMQPQDNLLRYIVIGRRNPRASYNLWKKIYQDVEAHGIEKVHATIMLNGTLDTTEVPNLVEQIYKLNQSRPITCAWVDHNRNSYQDNLDAEQFETPEQLKVRVFNSDPEAVEWLAEN